MIIVILEDDIALSRGIELALAAADRQFVLCHTIAAAKVALQASSPALFIVDINLPDGSGLHYCAELRSLGYTSPILILTANDTELDMVIGLQSGADDYVTKPFSLAVLRARIDALLRRGSYGDENSVGRKFLYGDEKSAEGKFLYGDEKTVDGKFVFDFETVRFEKEGKPLVLSKTEARLLQLLFANKGQIIPRERLLSLIWPDGTAYVDENALSVAIRRLRAKVEDDPSNPQHIKTVHGIGYKWAVDR